MTIGTSGPENVIRGGDENVMMSVFRATLGTCGNRAEEMVPGRSLADGCSVRQHGDAFRQTVSALG
jgi:hypothetical protein